MISVRRLFLANPRTLVRLSTRTMIREWSLHGGGRVVIVPGGGRLKQIAAQLHISEWTVATHVRRVFCKLGVSTRAGMVYRCAPLIGRRPDLDG